jgi:hypothetical protein
MPYPGYISFPNGSLESTDTQMHTKTPTSLTLKKYKGSAQMSQTIQQPTSLPNPETMEYWYKIQ